MQHRTAQPRLLMVFFTVVGREKSMFEFVVGHKSKGLPAEPRYYYIYTLFYRIIQLEVFPDFNSGDDRIFFTET